MHEHLEAALITNPRESPGFPKAIDEVKKKVLGVPS
jgi:hypothetical protein